MSNRIKSKTEWLELFKTAISPDQFQELCSDILRNNGYKNVKLRGKGADGGRDLVAQNEVNLTNTDTEFRQCWIQCKRHNDSISFPEISSDIQKADDLGVDLYILMSVSDVSAPTKDAIESWNKKHRCRVRYWTGSELLDLAFELGQRLKMYFPDEVIPPTVSPRDPRNALLKYEGLKERFGIDIKLVIPSGVSLDNSAKVIDIIKHSLQNIVSYPIVIQALIYHKVSLLFCDLEAYDDSILCLDKILEMIPFDSDALLNKGYVLGKIGLLNESTACYDGVIKLNARSSLAFNNKAHNLRSQGKLDDALACVDRAIEISPDLIIAYKNKIQILRDKGEIENALALLEKNPILTKSSVELLDTKSLLFLDLLDFKSAFSTNEEVLKINPNDSRAINTKGVIYEKNAKFQNTQKYLDLAYSCFLKSFELDPKYSVALSNQFVALLNLKKLDDARLVIDRAHSLFPKDSVVLNKKGVFFLVENRTDDALNYFEKALQYGYDDEYLINKTKSLVSLRKNQEALNTINLLLQNDSTHSEGWYLKAVILRNLHQTSSSELCLSKSKQFERKPKSLLE